MTLRNQKEEMKRIMEETESRCKEVQTILKNQIQEKDGKVQKQVNKVTEMKNFILNLKRNWMIKTVRGAKWK